MHEYPRVPHNHTEYTAQVLLRALALCFGEIFVMGAPPAAEVKLKPAGTAAAAARKRKLDSKRKRLVRLHTVACTISKMPSAQSSLSEAELLAMLEREEAVVDGESQGKAQGKAKGKAKGKASKR